MRSLASSLVSSWLASTGITLSLVAQSPPLNGPRQVDPGWHALQHATLVATPERTISDATVVFRDGEIVAVGANLLPPAGARVHDYAGLTIYAGLIDAHVPVDVAEPVNGPGRHWNRSVRAEVRAADAPSLDRKVRDQLRQLGFAAAAIAPSAGVFRGVGALVTLDDDDPLTAQMPRTSILRTTTYQSIDLAAAGGDYPNSLMGAIALVRQTLCDAQGSALHASPSLDALRPTLSTPLLFHAHDELDVLRAAKLGREFNRTVHVFANGTEFRRLAAIAAAKVALVVPLDFPPSPEVGTPADQDRVSLRDLMTWEQAPTNARRLDDAGVTVALTTDRLQDRTQFPARLREAVAHGLAPARALAMLTTIPAKLLGEPRLGTVEPGMIANLVVVRGKDTSFPYAKGNTIVGTWVRGKWGPTRDVDAPLSGSWQWTAQVAAHRSVQGKLDLTNTSAKLRVGEKSTDARGFQRRGTRVSLLLSGDALGDSGVCVMTGNVEGDAIAGQGILANGTAFAWQATRDTAEPKAADQDPAAAEDTKVTEELPMPFGAFGSIGTDVGPAVVIVEHATIWTASAHGVIRDGTLVARNGKIEYVGPAAGAPSDDAARVIDGRGLHLTPGLIDCHSHTGVSGGINESGQAVTAEVRIADVLNPDDINLYRQLAGGLTAANVLHGSANPIGGQNGVVKLRWGCAHPDDMLLAGAPGGIKFALGENPKRSRSRDEVTRYPRTRLGVEALIRDRFAAAREYERAHARHRALSAEERAKEPAPARDLELEALAEVLAGTRLVHCHSYRQDEILMLCRVATDFGFRIGTFQHVLEG